MNKLISALAKSCIIEEYNQHGNLIEDGFDYGKFAELIVQECAGLVQGVPIDTMGYLSADQKIKQHFGVEE